MKGKRKRKKKELMKKQNGEESQIVYIQSEKVSFKNTMKILHENYQELSDNLLSKILKRLTYYKNNLDDDSSNL